MKKSSLLVLMIVSIIFVQLMASPFAIQVKGETATSSSLPSSPPLANFVELVEYAGVYLFNYITNFFSGLQRHGQGAPNFGVDHIVVTPQTASIVAGRSQTFLATAINHGGNGHDVSNLPGTVWSINSGSGTYVWDGNSVQVNAVGSWIVTATYKGKSASATLTVIPASDKLDYITATVYPNSVEAPNVVIGTAIAFDTYGNSWDVSNSAVWSIPSGGDGGLWSKNVYTSHTAGTYKVQATYGGKLATATLTVTASTDNSKLASFSINPSTATVTAGSKQSYTAMATDVFGNNWDATASISASNSWSISANAGGSWNGATYTSEKAGIWTVTATYLGKTASATLTVNHANDEAHLAYIVASIDPSTVAAPGKATGYATAYDTYGNSWDISTQATWSIPTGGDGGAWNQNVYTSHTAGTYTVQAIYLSKTATTSLIVAHAVGQTYLDHIIIAPKVASINAGISQTYNATAYDTFGNSWSITAVYTCPDSNVVITGSSAYSNKAGTYIITGSFQGKTDTATITVIGHLPTAVSVQVSPKTSTIAAGTNQRFTATAFDGYNTWDVTSTVVWSVDIGAGGSWNQASGTYTSAVAGVWTVKATLGTLFDTATSTVTANSALLSRIVINPKTSTLSAGIAQSYTVTAYDQYGNSLGDVTASSVFVAPGALVTANSVKANNVGSYTVTATYNGLSDTSILTVTGYTAIFTETGLPAGASWTITLGGQNYTSTTDKITITGLSVQNYIWSTTGTMEKGNTRYSTAQTAGALNIPSQLSQTVDYITQYRVSYSAAGNVLAISIPPSEWINAGSKATGSYPTQVVDTVQDTRCNLLNDNRTSTITEPTTILATYQTQYTLTITSQYGTANGAGWYNAGSTATATLDIGSSAGAAGTQYTFEAWSGDASGTVLTCTVIMNSPKSVLANWKTQYYLTVNSPYGSTLGSGWYDAGSFATAGISSVIVQANSETRYGFNSWTGDASGSALTSSIAMTSPKTANATWDAQYQVIYKATGNTLPLDLPPSEWVTAGKASTGKFLTSASNKVNDTQSVLQSDNRTSTITAPTTITGTYRNQYKFIFNQTGISSDANSAVLILNGDKKNWNQLPSAIWANAGTKVSFAYNSNVATTDSNKLYILSSVNATSPITVDHPMIVQGIYTEQYSSTLYTVLIVAFVIMAIVAAATLALKYRNQKKKKTLNLTEAIESANLS